MQSDLKGPDPTRGGPVAVLGAGLGGLFTAVLLARAGRRVHLFEALSRPGGRFTDLMHDGYRLSTGALHIVPHGPDGPLMRTLAAVGVRVATVPAAGNYFRYPEGDRTLPALRGVFPAADMARVAGAVALPSMMVREQETMAEWFARHEVAAAVREVAFAVGGFALGVRLEALPAREVFRVIRRTLSLGGPLFLTAGCGSVADALSAEAERAGVILHLQSRVERLLIDEGRCVGLIIGSVPWEVDAVVSTLGPQETMQLAGTDAFPADYVLSVRTLKPALGLKVSVAASEPILPFRGVLFTPRARRLTGLVDLTQVDAAYAPTGRHLAMAYAVMDEADDGPGRREAAQEEVLRELKEWVPPFARSGEILAIQAFPGRWPVNRAVIGRTLAGETPVRGLHLAGDAVNPPGWMMAEGVAVSALRAAEAVTPGAVTRESECRGFLED